LRHVLTIRPGRKEGGIFITSNLEADMRKGIASKIVAVIASGLIGTAIVPSLARAAEAANDKAVLAGLQVAKVAFDIKEGDGKGLLSRLNIIDETRRSLIEQGVKPEFVLTFRGPATVLVQTDVEKIKPEDRAIAKQIAAKLTELSKVQGMQSFEQCGVAIRQQGTKAEFVLPEVKVVGNAWISLMAYQAKGYAYIAP
jgi:intracellular sulfur oxidation DsrE/DsrF family protein